MNSNDIERIAKELRGISANLSAIMAATDTLAGKRMEYALLSVQIHVDRIVAELEG